MSNAITDDVKAYCEAFDLLFLDRERLLQLDPDEYADVQCMGIMRDVHIVCVVFINQFGVCRVVSDWADGRKRLQDRFQTITAEQLRSAIALKNPLHPED